MSHSIRTDFQSVYDGARVISARVFQAGYIVRVEDVSCGGEDTRLAVAYSHAGRYIGNPKSAYFLCAKLGIKPEGISSKHGTCCIGYSAQKGMWYGWSHRAICGFKIGSEIKKGDCGFHPANREDFIDGYKTFWHDPSHVNEKFIVTKTCIRLTYDGSIQHDGTVVQNTIQPSPMRIPTTFKGRGAWVAKNMEDARQMAIDFSDAVS